MRSVLAAAVALGFVCEAQAVEVCYRLNPFIDHLELTVVTGTGAHHNLFGNWVVPGQYTLPTTGAREREVGSSATAPRRVGVVGTNNKPGIFNGNALCAIDGRVNGNWVLQCVGTGATFSTSGGPLTQISCAGLAPASRGARAIGSAR